MFCESIILCTGIKENKMLKNNKLENDAVCDNPFVTTVPFLLEFCVPVLELHVFATTTTVSFIIFGNAPSNYKTKTLSILLL